MCRGAATFMPRSRLVGCSVTGRLDDVSELLCGAVNYDTLLPLYFKSYARLCSPITKYFLTIVILKDSHPSCPISTSLVLTNKPKHCLLIEIN